MGTLELHRWSVDDYERMIAAGILGERDQVELLNGEIIEMSPIGPSHSDITDQLTVLFAPLLPDQARLRVQGSVRLSTSEPQPDLCLLSPKRYATGHPEAGDIQLIVEVADSSLPRDRQVKMPIYAGAGIREVWIVNIPDRTVEVHRDPNGTLFDSVQSFSTNATISPLVFPSCTINVEDIFG